MLVSSSNILDVNGEEDCKGAEYRNVLSRSAIYPISNMKRLQVQDSMVPWKVGFITKFGFLVMQIRNQMKWSFSHL